MLVGTIGLTKSVPASDIKVTLFLLLTVAPVPTVTFIVSANSIGLVNWCPEEVSMLEVKWSKSNLPYCVLSSIAKKSLLPV